MKNILNSLYWDIYSLSYELVENLTPHREINNKICDTFIQNLSTRILDAGCGTGGLILLLDKKLKNSEIYGIDISSSMLKYASRRIERSNNNKIKLLRVDITKGLPFPNSFFDGIACVHVINYINKPDFVISEFKRTLRQDGDLIIVSFKEKLSFTKLKKYHQYLIKEKVYNAYEILPLPFLYTILTLCNLPIRAEQNIKLYDENLIDKFTTPELKRIRTEDVFLNHSVFVHYKKL